MSAPLRSDGSAGAAAGTAAPADPDRMDTVHGDESQYPPLDPAPGRYVTDGGPR